MALDYQSFVLAFGIVILMCCFLAWLFEQRWGRWFYILLAHIFSLILLNLARLNAVEDSLSADIITTIQQGYIVMVWVTVIMFFIFMINLVWVAFESFSLIRKRKRQHPDAQSDYMEPRGTN